MLLFIKLTLQIIQIISHLYILWHWNFLFSARQWTHRHTHTHYKYKYDMRLAPWDQEVHQHTLETIPIIPLIKLLLINKFSYTGTVCSVTKAVCVRVTLAVCVQLHRQCVFSYTCRQCVFRVTQAVCVQLHRQCVFRVTYQSYVTLNIHSTLTLLIIKSMLQIISSHVWRVPHPSPWYPHLFVFFVVPLISFFATERREKN